MKGITSYFRTSIAKLKLYFWSLHGNAGTDPNIDFIGTTDDQPLILKTNNVEAVRILSDGKVGVNTIAPKFKLEVVGSLGLPTNTVNVNTNVTINDYYFEATNPAVQYTLETPSTTNNRQVVVFKNNSTGNIFVNGIIDQEGLTQIIIPPTCSVTLHCNGTRWLRDSSNINTNTTAWLYRSTRTGISQLISTTFVELTANTLLGAPTLQENQGASPVSIVNTNPVGLSKRFVFSPLSKNYYSFRHAIILTGTIAGGAGAVSFFLIQVRRGDGTTVVFEKIVQKVSKAGTAFTDEAFLEFDSDIFSGGADNFQGINTSPAINGYRIFIQKISGQNMTITGIDSRIKH